MRLEDAATVEAVAPKLSMVTVRYTDLRALIAEVRELKDIVSRLPEAGRLYTLKEAAALTSLSARTIQRGIAEGRYTAFKHERAIRVDLAQIREAMKAEGL